MHRCKTCRRKLGKVSRKRGYCFKHDPNSEIIPSWQECMKNPPSHYIGATKRYSVEQRLKLKNQWLFDRILKKYSKRNLD